MSTNTLERAARRLASLEGRHSAERFPDALAHILALRHVDAGHMPRIVQFRRDDDAGQLDMADVAQVLCRHYNRGGYRALLAELNASPSVDAALLRVRVFVYEHAAPHEPPAMAWEAFLAQLEDQFSQGEAPALADTVALTRRREALLRHQLDELRTSEHTYSPWWELEGINS